MKSRSLEYAQHLVSFYFTARKNRLNRRIRFPFFITGYAFFVRLRISFYLSREGASMDPPVFSLMDSWLLLIQNRVPHSVF